MKTFKRSGFSPVCSICLLLLCLCFSVSTFAASEEPEVPKHLMVWNKDGSCVSFPLEESPRISYNTSLSEINCVTRQQEVTFSMNDVERYTLSVLSSTELGIGGVASDQGTFRRDRYTLYFENFEAGSAVAVYTVGGVLVSAHHIGADGRLSLSIAGWQPGVYVVKTKSATYKMMKK